MEICGYENYLIYPDGRVFSKYKNDFMKPNKDGRGYYYVHLYKDGKSKPHRIHRLVAIHYIPNPQNKKEVDHKFRDKSDNRVENLQWVDHSENMQNTGIQKNNKCGHKNISYQTNENVYRYQKRIRGKLYCKTFKTKKEALCYKYIMELRIKAGHF